MGKRKAPNELGQEPSPYLQQHAYNPVDWYPWGFVALEKAKTEDKVILVSIGYSSCHWCHVMEHQSFENETIAAVMNKYFVNIKIDREERPDLDAIYMGAVQAMGLNGGWPLNVFLTPEGKPFYGGTYFPPQQWVSLLQQLAQAWQDKRSDILESAEAFTKDLRKSELAKYLDAATPKHGLTLDSLRYGLKALTEKFDTELGGIQRVPKFLMPAIWQLLATLQGVSHDEAIAKQLELTLTAIGKGGIYDQVRGGFARYSTDEEWFAPHFEKMLYDNGQLLKLYATALKLWPKNPVFQDVIHDTILWLEAEMLSPNGGFYSALDADSEGVEGKFYCFTYDEFCAAINVELDKAIRYYHITEQGNWEHGMNILHAPMSDEEFALANDLLPLDLEGLKQAWKDQLLQARAGKSRPGLDDKVLLGWNALTITGLIAVYQASQLPKVKELAINAITFIMKEMRGPEGQYFKCWKAGVAYQPAMLDDLAAWIEALLAAYELTADQVYLKEAQAITVWCDTHLWDEEEETYFLTTKDLDLIARPKELFDNVIPASNSIMANNLLTLAQITGFPAFESRVEAMLQQMQPFIGTDLSFTANWGKALARLLLGGYELVITGPDAKAWQRSLVKRSTALALVVASETPNDAPLFAGRYQNEVTQAFLCHHKVCSLPLTSLTEAEEALAAVHHKIAQLWAA